MDRISTVEDEVIVFHRKKEKTVLFGGVSLTPGSFSCPVSFRVCRGKQRDAVSSAPWIASASSSLRPTNTVATEIS